MIPVEAFAEAIDERTALVCCTTISYRTGHRQEIGEIARIAHERGALVLADSYQAVGAIELDARALDVDFVTGGHRQVPARIGGSRLSLRPR